MKYAGMSPKQLDKAATKWLEQHDTERHRQAPDRGPAVEWTLTPCAVELDSGADEDACEIAATFADLSGGRLVAAMVGWVSDEAAKSALIRREYMQRTRAHHPEKRKAWREAEKATRRAKAAALAKAMEHDRIRRAREVAEAMSNPRRRRWVNPNQLTLAWVA